MRLLFDHGVPRGLAPLLEDHTVEFAKALGWDTLSNGELLTAAEKSGFQILVTTDKNLPFQQNLRGRKIAVVVLGIARWRLIKPLVPQIRTTLAALRPGTYIVVTAQGT